MQKYSSTQIVSSVLDPLIHTIQFYASMMGGWWMFHHGVYPLAYFAKSGEASLVAQLPIYAINVMAFGCMAYVITRPFALFLVELLRAIELAINRFCASR